MCRLESDGEVRVIVVTGSGRYFCTGMDLGGGNQADMSQQLEQGTGPAGAIELYERFRNCTKPLIARINGPALGGGWYLPLLRPGPVPTKWSDVCVPWYACGAACVCPKGAWSSLPTYESQPRTPGSGSPRSSAASCRRSSRPTSSHKSVLLCSPSFFY